MMNIKKLSMKVKMTLLTMVALLATTAASAFTAPTAGDFGYDIYDVVVNNILGGPIGFVGAVALIVWGGSKVTTNWMITIMAVIAATIIIKADSLVTTLGALI